jgi:hypothetical protein
MQLLFLEMQALYWWGRLGCSKMKEDGAQQASSLFRLLLLK